MCKSYIFYTIHKKEYDKDDWSIGSKITIKENYFWQYSANLDSYFNYNSKSVPIINLKDHFKETNDINKQLKLLDDMGYLLEEYQILVRELAYEEVRKNVNKRLPSRKNCIWLCREDQIDFWIKRINAKEYDIYKIKVFKKPYKTNDSLLALPSESYNTMITKAYKYWQYSSLENKENDEYLYSGKFEIMEKRN